MFHNARGPAENSENKQRSIFMHRITVSLVIITLSLLFVHCNPTSEGGRRRLLPPIKSRQSMLKFPMV